MQYGKNNPAGAPFHANLANYHKLQGGPGGPGSGPSDGPSGLQQNKPGGPNSMMPPPSPAIANGVVGQKVGPGPVGSNASSVKVEQRSDSSPRMAAPPSSAASSAAAGRGPSPATPAAVAAVGSGAAPSPSHTAASATPRPGTASAPTAPASAAPPASSTGSATSTVQPPPAAASQPASATDGGSLNGFTEFMGMGSMGSMGMAPFDEFPSMFADSGVVDFRDFTQWFGDNDLPNLDS